MWFLWLLAGIVIGLIAGAYITLRLLDSLTNNLGMNEDVKK